MSTVQILDNFAFEEIIQEICYLDWAGLDEEEMVHVAWAYYFFSVQFRENLQIARSLHPEDEKLQDLEREECNTANLSPWPGVARSGEKIDHDEFMKRVLSLAPIPESSRRQLEDSGSRYLHEIREMDDTIRAMSITSYEDGGLERVFRAMLTSPELQNPLLRGFRHFLSEHVRFDSDPTQGHGAMIRHLRPDDRILPLWISFRDILVEFAPGLSLSEHGR
ncbi:hypothetical protein [Rhodopila sp.]|uniref:hypothetical protein n=1 Tax=Rhodopila sp. TaxID=2480087 RepID=UPI003D1239D8